VAIALPRIRLEPGLELEEVEEDLGMAGGDG